MKKAIFFLALLLTISCNTKDEMNDLDQASFRQSDQETRLTGRISVDGPTDYLPVIPIKLRSTPGDTPQRPGSETDIDTESQVTSTCNLPLRLSQNNTSCEFPITLDVIFFSATGQSTTTITFQNTTDYVDLAVPEDHEVRIDVSDMDCTGSFRLCKREGNLWNFIRGYWGLCYSNMEIVPNTNYILTFPRQWPKNPDPVHFLYTTYLCDDWCSETLDYSMSMIAGQSATNSAWVQISLLPEDGQKFGSSNFFMKNGTASVQNVNPQEVGAITLEPLLEDHEYTIEVKPVIDDPTPNAADLQFTINPSAEFAFYDNNFSPPAVTQNFLVQHNGVDCDASHTADCTDLIPNGVSIDADYQEEYFYELIVEDIPFAYGNIEWSTDNPDLILDEVNRHDNLNGCEYIGDQVPINIPITLAFAHENGCVIEVTKSVHFCCTFDDEGE